MKEEKILERITVRFAGDSGDGMQLTGGRFTETTALAGNDLTTLPDFPAEIRAPAGTLFGVSGFQIQFGATAVHTPGDAADVLVAMNPAALKVNLGHLKDNGIIIINSDAFQQRNLRLAGYEINPLEDDSLRAYQVFSVAVTSLTLEALQDIDLPRKEKDRCKNFFALGITYWMFSRNPQATLDWIQNKFHGKDDLIEANSRALNAGYAYALATEMFTTRYKVPHARKKPGRYKKVTGNEALALGLITAAQKAHKQLVLGSYPITPASDVLHELSRYKQYDVKTFQAEDEIAGVGAALGASYAGALGVTTTSGPGMALKSEFISLAVMTELPLLVIDIQRGGPSTGLPTKTEQADLLQAVFGRNGEAPVPVIAAKSPADCFRTAIEAARVAFQFTTPVILLSDGYIANGAEPWLIPDVQQIDDIHIPQAGNREDYKPYERDPVTFARKLAIPGSAGFEHHIGGLEKNEQGDVSYDPDNHHHMVTAREQKIQRINNFVAQPDLVGPDSGELLVVSWGSTYGPVYAAIEALNEQGMEVSWVHLRWINPLPASLAGYIKNFDKVLVPEINLGQLRKLIRAEYLVDAVGFNRVRGLPLATSDLVEEIKNILKR